MRTGRAIFLMAASLVALAACQSPSGDAERSSEPSQATPSPAEPSVPQQYTVLAAGDIASCDSDGDEATANLLDQLLEPRGGTVVALGDLAYEDGTQADFGRCYDPTWGRHKERTLPTPGNHEYNTPAASGYFDYFRAGRAGPPGGWYDVELFDEWWVISLNSNCEEVAGCGPSSPQGQYLTATLDRLAGTRDCILAFWHHPRWSSGDEHGSDPTTDPLWRMLADAGADILLTGHDHEYERFVPLDADGEPTNGGLTQFVVGTGGKSLYDFAEILPTSAARDSSTFGVLELTLHPGSYDWRFVPTEDGGYTDSGSASCD